MGALLSQAIVNQLRQYPGYMNPNQPPMLRLQNMLRPPGPSEPSIAGQGLQDISPQQRAAMNFAMGLEGGIDTGPLDPKRLAWLEGMPERKVVSLSDFDRMQQFRKSQDLIEEALRERQEEETSLKDLEQREALQKYTVPSQRTANERRLAAAAPDIGLDYYHSLNRRGFDGLAAKFYELCLQLHTGVGKNAQNFEEYKRLKTMADQILIYDLKVPPPRK